MTTASPSVPISYTSDTAKYLRISIPGLMVGPVDLNRRYCLQNTDLIPAHPVVQKVFSQLRSDKRIEAIVVTNYGLEVYHDHAKPSDIIRLIEPVL